MSAPVDTAEAVEAMVKELHFTVADLPTEIGCMAAAAMLRRLHARAVDAERERDEARNEIAEHLELNLLPLRNLVECVMGAHETQRACASQARAALATARADALREAFNAARALSQPDPNLPDNTPADWVEGFDDGCDAVAEAIADLMTDHLTTTTGET